MPHGLLKDFKSNLPYFAALLLGKALSFIINYVNAEINRIILELINKCPPPPVTASITQKVNTIRDVMNKYDQTISKVEKIPDTLVPAIVAGKVIVEILSHMVIPSSVPPGVGVPLGVIQSQSNLLVFTRKMIESLEDDAVAINKMVNSTKGVFNPVKTRLTVIEGLCARCTENPDLSDEDINSIINGVSPSGVISNGNISDLELRSGVDYIAANGNTYKIIIQEEKEEGFNIPRKRAAAKDFRGIVVLKGPLSFAGNTKVLIDELKFRLDQLSTSSTPINPVLTGNEDDFEGSFDTSNILDTLSDISSNINSTVSDLNTTQAAIAASQPLTVPKRWSRYVKRAKKKGTYVAVKLKEVDKKAWDKVKNYLTDETINDLVRGRMRKVNHPNIIRV